MRGQIIVLGLSILYYCLYFLYQDRTSSSILYCFAFISSASTSSTLVRELQVVEKRNGCQVVSTTSIGSKRRRISSCNAASKSRPSFSLADSTSNRDKSTRLRHGAKGSSKFSDDDESDENYASREDETSTDPLKNGPENEPKKGSGRSNSNRKSATGSINWSLKLAKAVANVALNKHQAEEHERQSREMQRETQLTERKAQANDAKRRALGWAPFLPSSADEEYYHKTSSISSDLIPLGNLSALTKILDERLYEGSARTRNIHPTLDGLFQSSKHSMNSLLGYNHVKEEEEDDWTGQQQHTTSTIWNIAILFDKRLVRDQVTVEYASRIQTLVNLLKTETNDNRDPDAETLLPSYRRRRPRPCLIVFCGSMSTDEDDDDEDDVDGSRNHDHISGADAGYILFRQICESQGIDLSDVQILIDKESTSEAEAVHRVTRQVQHLLPAWFKQRYHDDEADSGIDSTSQQQHISAMKHTTTRQTTSTIPINIHFSFISTEYHLCNINDIHRRSPRQSLLNYILNLEEDLSQQHFLNKLNVEGLTFLPFSSSSRTSGDLNNSNSTTASAADLHHGSSSPFHGGLLHTLAQNNAGAGAAHHSESNRDKARPTAPRIDIKTSWSFQYATYPYIHSKDEAVTFLGNCFLLGEGLVPALVNLHGVVEKTEFFQRENYIVLSFIRRSLVSQVEELCHPRSALKGMINSHLAASRRRMEYYYHIDDEDVDERPIEVILESALHSLGRCIDLVRPAGLHVSSVSRKDWIMAVNALEHSIGEIESACDPDRPLHLDELSKLTENNNNNNIVSSEMIGDGSDDA